jgi:DNA-binding transcriptional LysR family regulator
MDIRWLEDFLSLAATRSFVRSAEERHVSQAAFGRRIKAVEAWVGVPLVDRSSYPCALTREGLAFRDAAQETLRGLTEARQQLRSVLHAPRGGVTVVTGKTLSLTFFPQWFARSLGTEAPDVPDVRLVTSTMHDGTLQLIEGAADFFLCYSQAELPVLLDAAQFEYRVIGDETLLPVCATDRSGRPRFKLPGTRKSPVPLLHLSATTTQGRVLDAHLARRGNALFVERRIEGDFSEAIAVFARQGIGVAWLPERVVADDLASGRLAVCGSAADRLALQIRLYRRSNNQREPVARVWAYAAPTE